MTEMPTDFFALDADPYEVKLFLSDGTFTKLYRVKGANIGLPQHSHPYSHTSFIATGSVKVWKDGVYVGIVTAPDGILIEAHTKHFFQTLEENTSILCIHAITDGEEPEIEDEHVVVVGAAPVPAAPRAAQDPAPGAMQAAHPPRLPVEAFTFQEEADAEAWLIEAQPLFRQHLAATGQDPDGAMRKNIALGRQLAHAGALMVTTARSNGRMFAYLLAMISPTLDEPDILTAHLMLPFASPDAPGVGRKLQRATIEMLRAKGVSQVLGRAGVRGDGPRMGAIYERAGFVYDGAVYRLDL